jgi:hypothetical protein
MATCQAVGIALPMAAATIGKHATSADRPSGLTACLPTANVAGHRQRRRVCRWSAVGKGDFYLFLNFFADGPGRRHRWFADGRPSANIWPFCRRPVLPSANLFFPTPTPRFADGWPSANLGKKIFLFFLFASFFDNIYTHTSHIYHMIHIYSIKTPFASPNVDRHPISSIHKRQMSNFIHTQATVVDRHPQIVIHT